LVELVGLETFYRFFSKDAEQWVQVISDYWPKNQQQLDDKMRRLAARYRSPHKWSGKTVKEMAMEPDTFELDEKTGKPADLDFHYRVIFRWTSHYVHPTIPDAAKATSSVRESVDPDELLARLASLDPVSRSESRRHD